MMWSLCFWLLVLCLLFVSSNGFGIRYCGFHCRAPYRRNMGGLQLALNRGRSGPSNAKVDAPPQKQFKINEEIEYENVRLMLPILGDIGNDESSTIVGPVIESVRRADGVVEHKTALAMAKQLGLDLVLINEKGAPPVCKIVDVGKYKYALDKKKKESDKKQVHQVIKEFKISCTTSQHDLDIRIRAAREHIDSGDKVRRTMSLGLRLRNNRYCNR
jgi:translation initiation factor IF-3